MVFEAFRKRQKEFLVVLTLLAMFAFVLAGAIDQMVSRVGGGQDPVVAVAWGKKIMGSQIGRMQQDRVTANRFVARAREQVGLQPFYPFNTDEREVIAAYILREKGRRMGIPVTDADVTKYIHDLTENKLSQDDFFAVMSGQPGPGEKASGRDQQPLAVNDRELYRILADEILVQRTLEALTPAVILDTPYDLWRQNAAFRTMVQLQVAKIPVSKYVASTGEPDPIKMKEIFDRYKDRVGDLEEGVLGFQLPAKISADYMVAKVDAFLGKVTVTDAEIEKYYEANKSSFLEEEVPLPPARNLPGPPTEKDVVIPPAAPKDAKDMPKDSKAEKTPPKESPAKTTEKPREKPAKMSEPKAVKEAEEKTGEKETSAEPKKTSFVPGLRRAARAVGATAFWLADEKADPKKAEDAKTKEPPAATTAGSAKTDKPAEKAAVPDAKPADAKPAAEKPADAKAATEPKMERPLDAVLPTGKAAATDAAAPSPPKERYKPLSAVREEIVQTLKRQKATAKIIEEMQQIVREVLNPYLDRFLTAKSEYLAGRRASGKESPDLSGFTPPPPPDLEKIAASRGFELKSTGLVTKEQAEKVPGLGTAELASSGSFGNRANQFSEISFRSESDLYRPRIFRAQAGDEVFLAWNTKFQKARTPSMEEAKEQIIAAWRLEEAVPKAKEAAEKFAAAIRSAGGDFSKVFAKETGITPQTTRFFPRVTAQPNPLGRGMMRFPTVVEELPDVSEETLDELFAMEKGDVKVVADASGRNFYVVKMLERTQMEFPRFIGAYEIEMTYQRNPRAMQTRPERDLQRREAYLAVEREAGLQVLLPERPSPDA